VACGGWRLGDTMAAQHLYSSKYIVASRFFLFEKKHIRRPGCVTPKKNKSAQSSKIFRPGKMNVGGERREMRWSLLKYNGATVFAVLMLNWCPLPFLRFSSSLSNVIASTQISLKNFFFLLKSWNSFTEKYNHAGQLGRGFLYRLQHLTVYKTHVECFTTLALSPPQSLPLHLVGGWKIYEETPSSYQHYRYGHYS
jgi:hypothetical protein